MVGSEFQGSKRTNLSGKVLSSLCLVPITIILLAKFKSTSKPRAGGRALPKEVGVVRMCAQVLQPTTGKYYYYPHFTGKEPVTGRLNNLPKIPQLVSVRERMEPRQSGSRVCACFDYAEHVCVCVCVTWGVSTQKGSYGMIWNPGCWEMHPRCLPLTESVCVCLGQ